MSAIRHQRRLAEQFHRQHQGLLVLPNAWDPPSARMVASAGAVAVATTSAGVSWSHGVRDAGGLDRDEALGAAARVVAAVPVPVTIDIEGGYLDDLGSIEATVHRVLATGAVGMNIEDSRDGRLVAAPEQAELLGRALVTVEASTVPLFVNARIDTFLTGGADEADLLTDTVERARAYVACGVHGIFVPGVMDPEVIRALAAEVRVPLNVMVGAGSPPLADLAALGVRRISSGPLLAMCAYGQVREWARAMLAGRLDELPVGASMEELQPPHSLSGGVR